MRRTALGAGLALVLAAGAAADKPGKAPKADAKSPWNGDTFAGLELRGIGPAFTSGRVQDLAIDRRDRSVWYAAVASGGVWKTIDGGTSWKPIFDSTGQYSVGCVTIDPRDPLTVWVGSGENNSQRSVSYGDGVYKSTDGGATWENVGLKASEHVARIVVDPRDSKTVYVAAQGPLWASGGDRGLYKTTDGGKSWKRVLNVSENTGVSDLVMDGANPDVLYAAAYQRRRHVWTLIDGGPESAIYKSVDAGASWKKVSAGLPKGDMGRIGLAISAQKPEVVYAVIEAAEGEGGFYRSADGGSHWEKKSGTASSSPQYYGKVFADPASFDRVYVMDVWMQVSDDGGKTFAKLGENDKHSDNHVLWIDPDDPSHYVNGCDGGIYESRDRGAHWRYVQNLPTTQFYRVVVDNALPFYNALGGTQDNFSLSGPARTANATGITNADWYVTVGGDGFQTQVDPEDPATIYAEAQYGALVRFDKRTGERIFIQPLPAKGEPPLRYNWDSPLIVSPHLHTRIYFGANRLYRSDDRGDHWRAVSPDLTRQLDRNRLQVMGKIWSVDAVAKNASTSFYGNLVSLAESPLKEGFIYAGTDDGLVQVTEDGGAHWRKIEGFPGVPDRTYVSRLEASRLDPDVVFAAFDNHKMGDFSPYLLKSADRGRTWTSIAGDLPRRGTVYAVTQDTEKRDLLFAGTEFGAWFTADGGRRWIPLKGGMPPIAVRDIAIQRREGDLALATFGRGFYVLDDYTPLRRADDAMLGRAATLFPVKRALMYNPARPLGGRGAGFQGASFFAAPNPPFGAVFTYYLKDALKTRRKLRQEREKKLIGENETVTYPTWDELRAESREVEPAIVLTVTDEEGQVVRRLTGPATAGFHRVAWDLHYPSSEPVSLQPAEPSPFSDPDRGPMAAPGTYKVALAERVEGKLVPLGEPQTFAAMPLGEVGLPAAEAGKRLDFERATARLQRAVMGAVSAVAEAKTRLDSIDRALLDTPKAGADLGLEAHALRQRLADVEVALSGDTTLSSHNEPTLPAIADLVQGVVQGHWNSSGAPTQVQLDAYATARDEFAPVLATLHELVDVDLKGLEDRLEAAGAPWTPGRVPVWHPE
ncbi:MAG TPA: glycosyl hydrolase [Thermoanaerobaculia bacterium]